MNAPPSIPIIRTPEDIAQSSGLEIPPLLLPDPSRLFAERALRLRELAASHPMRDYLMLMAVVCEAQHTQAQHPATLVLPTQAQLEAAAEAGEGGCNEMNAALNRNTK